MHARQVGESALGEGAEQVQGGRALVVHAQQPLGVGPARLGRERVIVDHVATERWQLDAVARLGVGRPRLRELSGDATDLHGGDAAAVGEHDGHLQDDLELVADRVGRERIERLGAVARLQDEGVSLAGGAQGGHERARFACEHERREPAQLVEHAVERADIGPLGLLCRVVRRANCQETSRP